MRDAETCLRELTSYATFRPGQRKAIQAALDGHDALVVMPTGSGKSLCYQLPGLASPELTVVVSPLLALMRDQVDALRAAGHADVEALNSSLTAEEARAALASVEMGICRLLFVSPERFADRRFVDVLHSRPVDLFAVDEAHLLSEWGHDFRPDFRRLAEARDACGARCTMALTATATPRVADDIARTLRLREPVRVATGFDRPNLTFDVVQAQTDGAKWEMLAAGLARPEHLPAVVYAGTRRRCEDVAERLAETGLAAEAYHAGLSARERDGRQTRFMEGDAGVIVATTAFGMGIDKADVRSVWHWALPPSLEAYYQEAGRAGRDGLQARCVLLYASKDRGLIGHFITSETITAEDVNGLLARLAASAGEGGAFEVSLADLGERGRTMVAVAERVGALDLVPSRAESLRGRLLLRAMGSRRRGEVEAASRRLQRVRWDALAAATAFATEDRCRRQAILTHFGDPAEPAPTGRCCDVHEPPDDLAAGGTPGREALATAVVETAGAARPAVGRSGLDAILRGARRVSDTYGGLPHFGSARGLRQADVLRAIDAAIADGRLHAHGIARPVLRPEGAGPEEPSTPIDPELFTALREWRTGRARADGVPPYVVFGDSTLRAIAAALPASNDELLAIGGVGQVKVERYGPDVLRVVAANVPANG